MGFWGQVGRSRVQAEASGGSEGLSKMGILCQKTRDTSGEVLLKGSLSKLWYKLSGSSVDYHLRVWRCFPPPGFVVRDIVDAVVLVIGVDVDVQ